MRTASSSPVSPTATDQRFCGSAPGPQFQITSCRYSPPGNFDGQLPYPNADSLQVTAVVPASAAPNSAVAPVSETGPTPSSATAEPVPSTAGGNVESTESAADQPPTGTSASNGNQGG